ncbi:MAG: hypothetical protein JWP18_2076 [Solirubrobacterales bacterium]|jgi:hypothetical protein|nr:hypothetical protein [Solirubrobacterales bacterium]
MGEDVSRANGAQAALTGAPTGTTPDVEALFDRVLADFQSAIVDETAARRLGRIGFNAVIRVREARDLELWCLFHDPPEVRDVADGERADIEVEIPAALLEDFWTRHLALEILEGRVTYTGKVRKLLQMMPVIRAAVLRNTPTEVAS